MGRFRCPQYKEDDHEWVDLTKISKRYSLVPFVIESLFFNRKMIFCYFFDFPLKTTILAYMVVVPSHYPVTPSHEMACA